MLTVVQDGETQTMPACLVCWEEARNTKGIGIRDAKPILAIDNGGWWNCQKHGKTPQKCTCGAATAWVCNKKGGAG
jgi:hypothetical protein